LSQSEVGVSSEIFDIYDANSDGEWNEREIEQFLRGAPRNYELVIRVGATETGRPPVEMLRSETGQKRSQLKTLDERTTAIVLGTVQLDITVGDTSATAEQARTVYQQQFELSDADNNGYLEPVEVEGNPALQNVFEQMDADGDDKIFEKELLAYVDVRVESAQSRTLLTVLDQGHNLFDILDVNGDRRLGQREFGIARTQLDVWDTNSDGQLTLGEVPQHFRLTVGPQAPGLFGLAVPATAAMATAAPGTAPVSGPVWFRKMDRNRDGDVSRREFLGRQADFERLDRNGDGLIESREAEAAMPANSDE
jgi:hypothetical protein